MLWLRIGLYICEPVTSIDMRNTSMNYFLKALKQLLVRGRPSRLVVSARTLVETSRESFIKSNLGLSSSLRWGMHFSSRVKRKPYLKRGEIHVKNRVWKGLSPNR